MTSYSTTSYLESDSSSDKVKVVVVLPPKKRGKDLAGRKRTIDESKLSDDEVRKLELRRAYNRDCARNVRQRSKALVDTLKKKVENLTKEKSKLERQNEVMNAQYKVLERQNQTLLLLSATPTASPSRAIGLSSGGGLTGGAPAAHPSLQLNEALAFKLQGDPRLSIIQQLLALSSNGSRLGPSYKAYSPGP